MSTVDLRSVGLVDDAPAPWANWAGDQRCRPARFVRPESRDEVVAAVTGTVEARAALRVAGAGHSFSDAVLTDGHLLSLERMNALLDIDRAAGRVRVQAGMTINALSRTLDEHGLALENLGDIDAQSVAGAVATATHGTGLGLPNISAQVEALELVAADGTVHEIDGRDEARLRAARVSVGALGVVTAVTMRVRPAFTLRRVDEPVALDEVLDRIEELPAQAPHFEFFCFPHARFALTRTCHHHDGPPEPPGPLARRMHDVWLGNHALHAVCRTGRFAPRLIPVLNRAATRAAGSAERIDASYLVFASPRLVRFTEMETAIPRAGVREAVREVLAAAERHPVNFPIEVRFSAADDAFLSMASERESAFIAVHAFRGMPWQAYFREVQDILGAYGGRPHWGKRTSLTHSDLRARYPRWDDFQAVRRELDPSGRFANRYVRRLLGP